MDDAEDTFPLKFDEWEENAESEREAARRELVFIEPVLIDPAEFFSYCKEKENLTKQHSRSRTRE